MTTKKKTPAKKKAPPVAAAAPCSSSSILKRRMQLKRMEIRIEEAVSWNFGCCPSDIWFDELLDKRNNLSLIVSKTDPEWWAIYDRYQDADNCKRLMIFLPANAQGESQSPDQ